MRLALEENGRAALGDGDEGARRTVWSHHFLKGLRALGINPAQAGGVLQKVDVGLLRRVMQERWERVEWDTVSSLGNDQPWAPCSVRAAPNNFRRGFKKKMCIRGGLDARRGHGGSSGRSTCMGRSRSRWWLGLGWEIIGLGYSGSGLKVCHGAIGGAQVAWLCGR